MVPKVECPQDERSPDIPAHERGTFHEVRKSNGPFNRNLVLAKQAASRCAILSSTAVLSSQIMFAMLRVFVCFSCLTCLVSNS